jgi:hypothetical protein
MMKLITQPPKTLQTPRIHGDRVSVKLVRWRTRAESSRVEHLHCDPNSPADESVSSSVTRTFAEDLEEDGTTGDERVENTDDCRRKLAQLSCAIN